MSRITETEQKVIATLIYSVLSAGQEIAKEKYGNQYAEKINPLMLHIKRLMIIHRMETPMHFAMFATNKLDEMFAGYQHQDITAALFELITDHIELIELLNTSKN